MVRWNLVGIGLLTAMCFVACEDDERPDDATGGSAGEDATGGTSGDAGAPSGGSTATGGRATGGTATGGRATGGRAGAGGSSPEGGADSGGEGGVAGSAGAGSGGEGGVDGPAGAGGEGGASCIPTQPPDEVCDEVDNDCNGEVDDVDAGNDGIRDCIDILLIGGPGANSSSNFQAWLEEQGTTVSRIHASGTPAALAAEDLNAFDIVILDTLLRDYTPEESQALLEWVEAGGGLMSLNGHTGSSDLPRGNSLLFRLGVEHLPTLLSGDVMTFSTHPLTTGLTSVTFSGGYPVGDRSEGEGSVNVAQLAGNSVGRALERGSGRAFIWGDEWVEFDSEWQTRPEIETFWVNSIGWLSGAR
jgi:hypothetical protein